MNSNAPKLELEYVTQALEAYLYHIPKLYLQYLADDKKDASTPAKSYEMFSYLRIIVDQNKDEIILGLHKSISKYVVYYEIDMTTVDEFKYLYFMGKTLERLLKEKGKPEIARVVLFGSVIHLEECYKRYTGQSSGRKKLKDRLNTVIKIGDSDEHLGEYGIYLLYKCGSNMLKEFTEACPSCPKQ